MEGFLFQATIYLAATVVAVPIASRLGLGSVLGYLAAGIVIGPILGLVGHHETQDLQHFAEFGVVMMLFLIGLELEPRALWDMRHRLLGLGGLQIASTVAAVYVVSHYALGQSVNVSIALGMIFALSSTAIVLQTLTEKGLMQTNGGRSAFSVLLTQDIAVIPFLILLPLLGTASTWGFSPDGSIAQSAGDHSQVSLVEGLPGWGVALMTLGAVAVIIFAGTFLTRPLFRHIHAAKLRELYTAVALFIVVGIALLMLAVGLSPALGTFLAGVVLANTEFRHELESDIEPFKGLLLGLFFITVGAGINFGLLFDRPANIIALVVSLVLLKGILLFLIATIFGLRRRQRMLFTLSLAQAGEFGFVLVSFALQLNVLTQQLGETVLLVVALSMLFTPLLFILYDYLSKKMNDTGPDIPHDEVDDPQQVIIAGIGRFGQVVNRLVQSSGFQTTVLDSDLATIQLMRKFGFKGFFGDPTRPEMLHAAGLDDAKVLVVALDDRAAANKLVKYARSKRPDITIISRAHDRLHVYELYQAGADKIVREMFDSSLRAGRYVLESMGLSDFEASELEFAFFRHDRASLRELAELWDPAVPVSENTAYLERSKVLDKELETALVQQLDQAREKKSA
ncbi:monovalent cation:proton antiporter-2 (CPA2) family protein [Aliiroseovarius sp. PTFE2010]|uniref:monovalent cation:proton antiporter-2 (CPA2) family protein n=1 Tax=Aliiroseovarius sp. PTFE2010 TaxID=3417190 RepID=UPI003CF61D82